MVVVERVLPNDTHPPALLPAVFWQHLRFTPSMQRYHGLSRNGCSRPQSDTATESLGLLLNLKKSRLWQSMGWGEEKKTEKRKCENLTKTRRSVLTEWHGDASPSFRWDRQGETTVKSHGQVAVLKEEPSGGLWGPGKAAAWGPALGKCPVWFNTMLLPPWSS